MVIAAGACLFVPLSLSARANHTRASCSKVARFCSSSAVCAIFKHSAANRRYSSDRDIESSPPSGTIGGNAERVHGVPYAQPVAVLSFERWSNRSRLRRACWAQRDSNRPVKPHLENRFVADPDAMPRPFVGTLGLLELFCSSA